MGPKAAGDCADTALLVPGTDPGAKRSYDTMDGRVVDTHDADSHY